MDNNNIIPPLKAEPFNPEDEGPGPAPDYKYENGHLFKHIPKPKMMQCNKCNNEFKKLIPIYNFTEGSPFFNYSIQFLCKECFKDFILER